jgi:hypothetical protein
VEVRVRVRVRVGYPRTYESAKGKKTPLPLSHHGGLSLGPGLGANVGQDQGPMGEVVSQSHLPSITHTHTHTHTYTRRPHANRTCVGFVIWVKVAPRERLARRTNRRS